MTSVTTMPQLGIDDSRLASVRGVPRAASSVGIRNATLFMKRKELDVTTSETTRIIQRPRPGPTESGVIGSAGTE